MIQMRAMRSRLSVVLPVMLAAALLFSCSGKKGTEGGLIIDGKQNGNRVDVKEGDVFRIKLEAQLSTGYSWKIEKKSDNIELIGKPEVETQKKDIVGGIDFQIFSLKAKEKGEGTILMHYVQPWEKKKKPEKTYSLKLNIQ